MCGIAGFVGDLEHDSLSSLIERMKSAMVHRGPDAAGSYLAKGVAMGHTRLKIIDLSSSADQPFKSSDGRYCIVFNGEIYNYLDIAQHLGGEGLRTNSDTEVLLRAFMKWGLGCVERLNGMFAFAVWDEQEQELIVVRDRLGIKPVYYHNSEAGLLFASEIRALLSSGLVPRELDHSSLAEYLSYHTVHAPRTLVRDVQLLRPGHLIRYKKGELLIEKYWDPQENRCDFQGDKTTAAREVKDRLLTAVERRLIADVPLGAFLSGGIDSTALVGLMAEVRDEPIDTFSVVFDEKRFSEQAFADLVAAKFRTEHHVLPLRSKDLLASLPEILSRMDHPSVDGPNTYMVSEATKNAGITVALSGLGGDELFAGYPVFKQLPSVSNSLLHQHVPTSIRASFGRLLGSVLRSPKGLKAVSLLAADRDFAALYPLFRKAAASGLVNGLIGESSFHRIIDRSAIEDLLTGGQLLSAISVAEITTYMQNVLLRDADQMSMAHALEIRVPFLDHELVEYVMGIPDDLKEPTSPKKLLVDSLSPLIPDEVVNRKKMGFTFPWELWLRQDLNSFCSDYLGKLGNTEYFNSETVQKHWSDYRNGHGTVQWTNIWSLVVLAHWMEVNKVS